MNELKKIQYNCRKATFLVDKKMYGKITFREQMELHIHLLGCDACKLYVKQSKKIGLMITQMLKATPATPVSLSDTYKEQLQQAINSELNKI